MDSTGPIFLGDFCRKGSISDHKEVESREWHHVHSEFSKISIYNTAGQLVSTGYKIKETANKYLVAQGSGDKSSLRS